MPSEAELGEETKMGKRVKYIHIHKKKKDWPDLDFAGEAASQPAGSSSSSHRSGKNWTEEPNESQRTSGDRQSLEDRRRRDPRPKTQRLNVGYSSAMSPGDSININSTCLLHTVESSSRRRRKQKGKNEGIYCSKSSTLLIIIL